jgi:hypothetical protein
MTGCLERRKPERNLKSNFEQYGRLVPEAYSFRQENARFARLIKKWAHSAHIADRRP